MKKLTAFLLCAVLIFAVGCSKTPPTAEHKLMLSINSVNRGLLNRQEDYWAGDTWSVYYDGEVEFYSEYNLSGKKDETNYCLDEEQINELYGILTTTFKLYSEDDSASDGTGYGIVFYDENGNELHSFAGYIYNNKTLQKIVKIASDDMEIDF